MTIGQHVLQTAIQNFKSIKTLGDKTLMQLTIYELCKKSSSESNSISIIVRHLHGNMLSRWTDFLTTDGEKATRNRDSEFEIEYESKEALIKDWEDGWRLVFSTLEYLTEADLEKKVTIRGEVHTVIEAIFRQISHYAYHIGQIVYIGKEIKNENFQCLSIPKRK
ncbi:MAG: DUF1572 family protein [Bacillaceae bacterium]